MLTIFVSSSFCSYCVNDSLNSSFAYKTWDILIVITNLTNRLGLQAMASKEGCCPFCRKDSITNVLETTSQVQGFFFGIISDGKDDITKSWQV
ncbi:Uncharacterised protein [Mycobacterium tuberculosis]|nr:Uncharacterised protein [Mycobacterium tuberculosis]